MSFGAGSYVTGSLGLPISNLSKNAITSLAAKGGEEILSTEEPNTKTGLSNNIDLAIISFIPHAYTVEDDS